MTRAEAQEVLRRLAHGLQADLAGCRRFLERVAGHDEAELLRSALMELGAERLLDQEASSR